MCYLPSCGGFFVSGHFLIRSDQCSLTPGGQRSLELCLCLCPVPWKSTCFPSLLPPCSLLCGAVIWEHPQRRDCLIDFCLLGITVCGCLTPSYSKVSLCICPLVWCFQWESKFGYCSSILVEGGGQLLGFCANHSLPTWVLSERMVTQPRLVAFNYKSAVLPTLSSLPFTWIATPCPDPLRM